MTSQTILTNAEDVFAAQGVRSARMEDIAARAGVAVGTLYNYFSDREQLVSALLEFRRARLIELLDQRLEVEARAPFDEQLDGLVRALLQHFDDHRAFFAILAQGEFTGDLADATCKMRSTMRDVHARIDRLMARGVASGRLRPEHAALYPAMVMGTIRGVILNEFFGGGGGRVSDHATAIAQLFVQGAGQGAPPHEPPSHPRKSHTP